MLRPSAHPGGGGRHSSGHDAPDVPLTTRHTTMKFAYNGRAAFALIPALVAVVSAGGTAALACTAIGSIVAYILDVSLIGEGALIVVWLTLLADYLCLAFGGRIFNDRTSLGISLMLSFACGQTLFLVGAWASLQFKSLQLQYPGVIVAAERLLFASAPIVSAVVVTWALMGAVGASATPFYSAALCGALYFLFGLPLRSSFFAKGLRLPGGGLAPGSTVLAPSEAACLALAFASLPMLLYLAVHRPRIWEAEHLSSFALLASAPQLALAAGTRRGALWWTGLEGRPLAALQLGLGSLGLVGTVLGFEGRVVFRGFAQYIRAPPPLSYALVATSLFCCGGAGAAVLAGFVPRKNEGPFRIATATLTLGVVAGSLATGMPRILVPAGVVSVAALAQFHLHRSLTDYVLFSLGAAVALFWFLGTHFLRLDMPFGGTTIRAASVHVLTAAALAALPPGLWLARARPALLGLALCAHAAALAHAEAILAAEGALEGSTHVYPPYLLGATSALGLLLARWLAARQAAPPALLLAARVAYASKLVLLALPGRRPLLDCALVGLAAALPSALFPPPPDAADASSSAAAGSSRRRPMTRGVALLLLSALAAALVFARFTLFDLLDLATGRRPTDALLFGGLLFFLGAASAPAARAHFPSDDLPRRVSAALLAAGAGLLALRPPLPWRGDVGWWYDAVHVPDPEPDDAEMYGARSGARSGWPAWLLIGAAAAALLGASSTGRTRKSPRLRLGTALGVGGCLGVYLAAEYFPPEPPLAASVVGACAASAVAVAFALRPGPAPAWLPLVFAAQAALLPAGLVALGAHPLPGYDTVRLPGGGGRAAWAAATHGIFSGGHRHSAEVEARLAEARGGLVAVHATLSALLAFCVKLRVGRAQALQQGGGGAGGDGRAGRGGFRGAASASGGKGYGYGYGAKGSPGRPGWGAAFHPRSSPWLQSRRAAVLASRAVAEAVGEGLPGLGNAATLLAFALLVVLTATAGAGGSHASILAVAPVLLLLNRDGALFSGLGEEQRYGPVWLAVWVYLTASALLELRDDALSGAHAHAWGTGEHPTRAHFLARNGAALAAALPSQVAFTRRALGGGRAGGAGGVSEMALLLLAPLNLPAGFLADLGQIRWLAFLGFVASVFEYSTVQSVRSAGQRIL